MSERSAEKAILDAVRKEFCKKVDKRKDWTNLLQTEIKALLVDTMLDIALGKINKPTVRVVHHHSSQSGNPL